METSRNEKYVAMVVAVVSTLTFLFPIYWMVVTSIKPMNELFASPPTFYPHEPTFLAYKENLIENQSILGYIGNSFFIGMGTMIVALLLAAPVAYALARLDVKGKALVMILLLTSQMMPGIMLAMPLFIFFSKVGLLNSYLALIIGNSTHAVPFAIVVLRPYFLSVPSGLEDAAVIDGCNKFTTFWRIFLPLIKPGLLTVGAFCFLFGWGDFLFALTLTTDNSIRPLTLGLYKFIGEYGINWNGLMTVATITAIPIIIIFISLQKYIVSGIAAGAMKD